MRIIIFSMFIFSTMSSCQKGKIDFFDLNEIPNDWVRLTEMDKALIIYNTCDNGNLLLTIKPSGRKPELLLHGQQEDNKFSILETKQINDTIFIETKYEYSDENQEFKFVWMDKQKGKGRWITTYSNGYKANNIFVTSKKQTGFKKIDQPCRECWGDECD